MVAQRLDGKACSMEVEAELSERIQSCIEKGIIPHIAVIIVGQDPASHVYVGAKIRACERLNLKSTHVELPEDTLQEELRDIVAKLNQDDSVHGILIQSPLPSNLNEEELTDLIDPAKDVDGFHPANFGRMALDLDAFIPATPFGIMQLLERYKVPTSGKHCVVVGRSHIVGRPISILMSQKGPAGDATVTVAHSRTQNLAELTRQADIVVMALGIPEYLTANMVKEGATIIDVGITRVTDDSHPKGYVIKGDVAFDEVAKKASFITPVPGGVGPMTIAMLLQNTLLAREWRD